MKDINFPPFYPGQRVVCIDDSRTDGYIFPFKKGDELSIISCHQCTCKTWMVDIGIQWPTGSTCHCGVITHGPIWFVYAKRFVPIEEKFESISLTKVYEIESPLISVN